jgi:hypothetical protein
LDYYSLVFNKGTAEEKEIFLRYHDDFNPDGHRPKPRTAVKQMLGGVAIQESAVIHGGHTITMTGVEMTDDDIALIKTFYESEDLQPFIYRDSRKTIPEEWLVTWSGEGFRYQPYLARPNMKYRWSIELVTLGKLAADGTVLP